MSLSEFLHLFQSITLTKSSLSNDKKEKSKIQTPVYQNALRYIYLKAVLLLLLLLLLVIVK